MRPYTVDLYKHTRFIKRSAIEADGPVDALKRVFQDLPSPLRLVRVTYYNEQFSAALPDSTINFVIAPITTQENA